MASGAFSDAPSVPFSGAFGATSGAGSLLGWERHGADNPAAMGSAGEGFSFAGYSPFGIADWRVMEASAAFDRARWGSSLAWRGFFEEGRAHGSRVRMQGALRFGKEWKVGSSLALQTADGTPGVGARPGLGLGLIWHPWSLLTLGAAWETASLSSAASALSAPSARGQRVGFGADCGTRLGIHRGTDYAWRISVERHFLADGSEESRYGFGFRFHPLLALYAGYAPSQESASLGVRFGMGDFRGFSAMRRHTELGGTSIQGVQWSRGAWE